jgi:hypothetical protein
LYFFAKEVMQSPAYDKSVWWIAHNIGMYRSAYADPFDKFAKRHFINSGMSVSAKWDIDCDFVLKYEELPYSLYDMLGSLGCRSAPMLNKTNISMLRP